MKNPAAILMAHWAQHGALTINDARELLKDYPREQVREAWEHYQANTVPADLEFDDPLDELIIWLRSMQTPDDFAGFDQCHDRETREQAWKILPHSDRARILPLIKAYKARETAEATKVPPAPLEGLGEPLKVGSANSSAPPPPVEDPPVNIAVGSEVLAQLVVAGDWTSTEWVPVSFVRMEGRGVMRHYVVRRILNKRGKLSDKEERTHWIQMEAQVS